MPEITMVRSTIYLAERFAMVKSSTCATSRLRGVETPLMFTYISHFNIYFSMSDCFISNNGKNNAVFFCLIFNFFL
jgi:hypothetical protein